MDFSMLMASYRPPCAIEQEVLESLNRRERSRRSLTHLADCIIHCCATKRFIDILDDEGDKNGGVDINGAVSKGLRLLHFAVYGKNETVLNHLLSKGADPNLMDDAGYTPLHLCAEKGYSDLITLLLQYGARLTFTEVRPGDTAYGEPPRATSADEPLRLAIRNTKHETALLLLKLGANPSATYTLGEEINLVDPMDFESLDMLLKFGANPNSRGMCGYTPLMKACRNKEAIKAVHLLISFGADVNTMTDTEKRFPLHFAVVAENLEIVKILVQNGAMVRFPPDYLEAPPHYFAVLKGNVPILNYLIDSGADVNSASTVFGSALHVALTEKIPNRYEIVTTLLERGANPNATTFSNNRPLLKTPMGEYFQHCEQPNLKLIKQLLKYGARIILRCQKDDPLGIVTVIHRLHLGIYPEVMNIVIEACESFNVSSIETCRQMSDEHKELLLDRALQPYPLRHIARLKLRHSLGWGPLFVHTVTSLAIPKCLKEYLFYDYCDYEN